LGETESTAEKLAAAEHDSRSSVTTERRRRGSDSKRPSLDHFAARSQAALSETDLPRPIRIANRHPSISDFEVCFSVAGQRSLFALLDISNRGLAARVPPGLDLESILPGRHIAAVSISAHGQEVLEGVDATVRRLTVCRSGDTTSGYEVGLEFAHERRARRSDGQSAELVTQARIAEVVEEGLRNGLSLTLLDGMGGPFLFSEGTVDTTADLLHLRGGASAQLRFGDTVRVTCDVTGFSCSFFAAIVSSEKDGNSLVLRLPRVIRTRRARLAHRLRPAQGNPVEIEIRSPFEGTSFKAPALDINSSGISFAVDSRRSVLPVGTTLDPLLLVFPDGRRISLRGRVRSLAPLPNTADEPSRLRCGVEFESLPDSARSFLADDVVRSARPSLANSHGLDFAKLWSFLSDSGFLYPEKLDELGPALPQIEQTFTRLLDGEPNHLLKTIVCQRDGELLGHISTLRLYRRTWLIQHLASRRQVEALFAAEVLNLGLIEYLEQIPQLEWCRVFFRPNNRWPARVFGTFARRLNEPLLSDLREYSYYVGATAGTPHRVDRSLRLVPAQRQHLEEVQRFFLATGRVIALQADDLSLERLLLDEVDGLYGESGLQRKREIIVAERGSALLGFALLEISSAGLNLSELTNHFSVHVMEGGGETRRALIDAARNRYRELGRPVCVSLSEGDDPEDYRALGLKKLKQYMCWTGHRSLLRAYSDYILRLFGQAQL
jgi:hypothetical protein